MARHTKGKLNTHAIMFHHFHDEQHPKGQGSLSAAQFEEMIDWLSERFNLLQASEYQLKLRQQTLEPDDICFTFDDALLCQYDIAVPVLKKRNIEAFFFIYSSPFVGDPDFLEIYRYFRTTEFESVDLFYGAFFDQARVLFEADYVMAQRTYDKGEYLKAFPFYSDSDKWFRFLRDVTLGKERYEEIMRLLMHKHDFEPRKVMKNLWMSNEGLRQLLEDGHTIGLHSYSHPTTMHLLDGHLQGLEYRKNFNHLSEVLGAPPWAMSHPCGNYSDETLKILESLNIQIGFRSNNSIKRIKSNLEVPREDHANVLKEMQR